MKLTCNLNHVRVAVASILLPTVILELIFLTPRDSGHNISYDTYEKIVVGMAEKDVVLLLGVPSGQYIRGTVQVNVPTGPTNHSVFFEGDNLDDECLSYTVFANGNFLFHRKGWIGETHAIWVWFSEDGTVMKKRIRPVWPVCRTAKDIFFR